MKKVILTLAASTLLSTAAAAHFNFETTGDEFIPVVIPVETTPTLDGVALEAGDEIGLFTKDGICAGAVTWKADGAVSSFNAWSDNSQTSGAVEGFINGDTLMFRIWDNSANREFAAQGIGSEGAFVFSSVALYYSVTSLTALSPVEIVAEPAALSLNRGARALFEVTANGGGTLTYQWLKDGVAIDGATSATYSIAAVAFADTGAYSCVISNGTSTATSAAALLTVNNQKPTLTATTAQSVNEDESLEITLAMTDGADADGEALTVIVEAGSDYTVEGTTITPTENFNGELSVPVKVTDGIDTSDAVVLIVTVGEVNDEPTSTIIENVAGTEGSEMSIDVAGNFSDIEDADLTITAEGLPQGLTITDGIISGTPTEYGEFIVTVTAADSKGAEVSESFTLTLAKGSTEIIQSDVKVKTDVSGILAVPTVITSSDNEAHFVVAENITGEATITVFDALGNTIDQATITVENGGHYLWDLTNRYGQKVANGGYVVILELTKRDGSKERFKSMFGIKQ